MNYRRCVKKISTVLVFSFALSGIAQAGIPDVANILVTDVTTRSFSVIWGASEAAIADLGVYADEDGLVAVSEAVITAHPVVSGDVAISTAAEDNGVMKVQVTGLEPDTTYYFQTVTTSKSTDDLVLFPDPAPLLPVTTEHLTVRTIENGSDLVPFGNDVIIWPCYLADGVTPAAGTLLLATIEGANYPLTAFVGDGVDSPDALIDLNNAFGFTSHENVDFHQGENLTLLNFRGMEGNSIITYDVPLDNSLAEVKPPAYSLKPGWNMVSIQLDPVDPTTDAVLDPIIDQISSIWTYDNVADSWQRYDKNNLFPWLNDLTDIGFGKGYWLFVDEITSLPTEGIFSSDPQQLYAGWNLVGAHFIETIPLAVAIAPIQEQLNSIWTYDTDTDKWLRFDKNNPFPWLNDLQYIKPGNAYWVDVTEDCQW